MRTHPGGLSPADALLVRAAVFASAGAGAIHLAATHEHLTEWWPAGVFMFVAGCAQLIWVAWVAGDIARHKLIAGLTANAGIVALWLGTRTIGMPFGPMAGVREHPHVPDLIATGLEVVFVVAAAALLFENAPRPARRLMVLAVTGLILAAAGEGHEALRGRVTVVATLAAVAVAAGVSVSFSRAYVTRKARRSNAEAATVGPDPGARDDGPRTVVVPGGRSPAIAG